MSGPDQIGAYLNKREREQSRRAAQGSHRISKSEFYKLGGLTNTRLWRKQTGGGAWRYYETNN